MYQDFVHKASVSTIFEIESGKLALERAEQQEVKDFAERMIRDHEQTSENLMDALSKARIETAIVLAEELDEEHKQKLKMLEARQGAEFDKEYLRLQEEAHEQAVNLFVDYSENGESDDLKEFARRTLPMLEEHQEMIDTMAA